MKIELYEEKIGHSFQDALTDVRGGGGDVHPMGFAETPTLPVFLGWELSRSPSFMVKSLPLMTSISD